MESEAAENGIWMPQASDPIAFLATLAVQYVLYVLHFCTIGTNETLPFAFERLTKPLFVSHELHKVCE